MAPPTRSVIWNYFKQDKQDSAQCNICKKSYSRKGRTTTSLKSHLKSIHPEEYALFLTSDTEKKSEEISKEESVLSSDDELFITIVREFPELYDPKHALYDDRPRRDVVWQEIGNEMNQSAQSCRDRWKRMRDNYRRALKLRTEKSAQMSGDVAKRMSCPKNEKLLSFLNPFLGHITEKVAFIPIMDYDDSSSANDSLLEETHSSDITTIRSAEPAQHAPCKRKCADPVVYPEVFLEQNHDPLQSKRDKTVDFFTNLGETVKDFPVDVQIQVKREAFRIVSEAEEMVLRRRTRTSVRVTMKEESSPEH